MKYLGLVRIPLLTALVCALTSNALATSYTWVGGTNNWGTNSNWNPSSDYPGNTVPADTASFSTTGTTEIGLAGGPITPSLDSLIFQNNHTLQIDTGNILTLGATTAGQGVSVVNTKTLTLTNNGTLNFNNTSSANTGLGSSNITNNFVLNFNNSSNASNANISNANVGTINFNGTANAANAGITNNSGIIDISGMSTGLSIGTLTEPSAGGRIFLGGNTLTVGGLNFAPFASIMSIIQDGGTNGGTGGSLIKIGTGLVSTSGNHTYTGTTEVRQGQLNVNTGGKLGSGLITVDSGATLSFIGASNASTSTVLNHGTVNLSSRSAAFTLGSLSDTSSSPGSLIMGSQNISLGALNLNDTIFGVISGGAGTLFKVGTGTLTLNGANTYTGATEVQQGALIVGSGGHLGAGVTTVDSATSLKFTGTANAASSTVVNHGTVDVSGMTTALSIGSLSDTIGSPGSVTLGNTALSLGVLNNNDDIFGVISGSALSSLTKVGSGTLTLNGINTYTGATTVQGGSLIFNNSGLLNTSNVTVNSSTTLKLTGSTNATQTAIINHGTLDVSSATSPITIGSLSDNSLSPGDVMLGDTALSLGALNNNNSIFGVISGTALSSLTKTGTGTLTLNGINTYTGLTTVSAGSLIVGDFANQGASVTGNITVNPSGSLSGFGTIGTLLNPVTLTNHGLIDPGDNLASTGTGTLDVLGDFIATPGSTFQIDIGQGGMSDLLAITGTASLSGNVTPQILLHSFDFGTPYTILTAGGGVSGTFDSLSFAYDGTFNYYPTYVTLTFGGIKDVVANTPIAYANQVTALAQAGGWFDDTLEGRMLGYASDKTIYRDRYASTAPNDPTLWLEGNTSSAKSSNENSGFTSDPKHLALGLEWSANDILSGFGLAYTHFHTEGFASSARAKADASLYQGGAYTRQDYWDWRLGLGADIGFTSGLDTQQAYFTGGKQVYTSSSSHAYQISAQAEAAYTGFNFDPQLNLQPLAALLYRYVNRASFTQKDNVGLEFHIAQASNISVRSQLGLDLELALINTALHPFGFIAWEHEYGDNSTSLKANLQSISTIFKVTSAGIGRDALATKLGITASTPKKAWNFAGYYEGRFAKNYHENAAKLAVNYSF